MPLIVPRLQLNHETIARLQSMASERGTNVSEAVISCIEGRWTEEKAGARETLFRILLAGEKNGLVVNGSNEYPADWNQIGGLDPTTCRKIAVDYKAWKQKHGTSKT